MKKKLEVGDVLYNDQFGITRIVIERVTKTQAISGNTRVQRGPDFSFKEVGTSGWHVRFWKLETPELKDRYRKSNLLNQLRQKDFGKLPADKLEAIVKIINGE